MTRVFDLVVIGGGPAGACAAITAAQLGFDVVLLEAGRYPRHKVCGEFVSGEALSLLEQLLGSSKMLDLTPRVSCARGFVDERKIEFPVVPAARGLSRFELDWALWRSAVNAGVIARQQTRVISWRTTYDRFAIHVEGEELVARALIDASGRWSSLRTERPKSKQHWIGIKGHFLESSANNCCDLYFFEGGYCGVQALGNGRLNAAAMVRADVAHTMGEVLKLNKNLAERSECWSSAGGLVSTAPLIFRPPQTYEGGAALCGDAAAFLDPFAGDGISMAVHSGQLAAQELTPYLRRECSLTSALQAYDFRHRDLLQPALKNAARLRRLLQLPRWLRFAAITLLQFRPFARVAVNETRVRQAV